MPVFLAVGVREADAWGKMDGSTQKENSSPVEHLRVGLLRIECW